jgi:hypothetical protein
LAARLRLALLCVLALAPLAPASAQLPLPEVQPGTRVRVRAPGELGGRVEAIVIDRKPDTLRLAPIDAVPVRIPIAAITSLEINRGPSRRAGALEGAKWGAVSGLAFGLLNASFSDCAGRYCETGYRVGGVAAFGAVGAGIGAAIGAARRADRWEPLDIPERSALAREQRGGPGIGLRLEF